MYSRDANGAEWYALIDNDPQREIPVTHYTYEGLNNPDDYPATVRIDWAVVSGQSVMVLGIRCGMAWCLLGAGPSITATLEDPDDPDQLGTGAAPRYRRVRGWYDRRVADQQQGTYSWIFPGVDTGTANADEDFDDKPRHQITIIVAKTNDLAAPKKEIKLERLSDGAGGRDWWFLDGAVSKKVKHIGFSGKMPAAARWGKSHEEVDPPNNGVPLGTRFISADVWVRCASGCCSANMTF